MILFLTFRKVAHLWPTSEQLTTKDRQQQKCRENQVVCDMGIFFVEDVYISADGEMKEEFSVLYVIE